MGSYVNCSSSSFSVLKGSINISHGSQIAAHLAQLFPHTIKLSLKSSYVKRAHSAARSYKRLPKKGFSLNSSRENSHCTSILAHGQRLNPFLRNSSFMRPSAENHKNSRAFVQASIAARGNVAKKVGPEERDDRLVRLREEMSAADGGKGVDAYILPSEDPHQSEYSADCFARREYISRFTGSAGTAVVLQEQAALWTDGRYFLQAEQQLGKEWQLMRSGQPGVPAVGEWLRDTLPPNSRVGIDPFLFSMSSARTLKEQLAEKGSILVPLYDSNLADAAWGDERPRPPSALLRVHPLEFAGISVAAKLTDVRRELVEAGATALVVSLLDEVAWLLNVRGGDVPHCPVAIAYVIVELETATLFVDETKVGPDVAAHLAEAHVSVKPYSSLVPSVIKAATAGAKLWLDPDRVSTAVFSAFDNACQEFYTRARSDQPDDATLASNGPAAILRASPIQLAKAQKNPQELEGMRQAHLRDAAALAGFWSWLEAEIGEGGKVLSEAAVGEKLQEFRSQQAGFLDTSFDTIAGSGPNGAIIHYRAVEGACADVTTQKLFLLDSGGQYVDGTTDITRTCHLGTPSAYQKECFTRVLQGHMALDQAVFPEGTPGFVLDVLARNSLWKIGLDYRHGTGHGVGAALNVHEGPQGISSRFGNNTGLVPGMIVSNEPGYYEDGAFGIRIENLLAIKEADTPNRFGGNSFLGFERLTFFPIQAKMVDLQLLSDAEIQWLNEYHAQVWEKVSPLVTGNALEWLRRNTEKLERAANAGQPAKHQLAVS